MRRTVNHKLQTLEHSSGLVDLALVVREYVSASKSPIEMDANGTIDLPKTAINAAKQDVWKLIEALLPYDTIDAIHNQDQKRQRAIEADFLETGKRYDDNEEPKHIWDTTQHLED